MSNALEPRLDDDDVRALVHLLGKTAAEQSGPTASKDFLLRGLCQLIGADKWARVAIRAEAGGTASVLAATENGFEPEHFRRLIHGLERSGQTGIENKPGIQLHGARVAASSSDSPRSEESAWLCSAADIGQAIVSIRPGRASEQNCIGLFRGVSRPPFHSQEIRIAQILLGEIEWLHDSGEAGELERQIPHLSPRQRLALTLLLDGQSRKEIAHRMGISIHTVAGYVKSIFRHFKVQSQSGLMRRFRHGPAEHLVREAEKKTLFRRGQKFVLLLFAEGWAEAALDLLT